MFKWVLITHLVYSIQFQIIGTGVAGRFQIKWWWERGGLKNVLGQKWQPVITNHGCPKQLLKVEKHQYNFSCSLHLSIKQNRTFLTTDLTNVNTKSCLRNQTRLCIHLLVLLVPSHWHVVLWVFY